MRARAATEDKKYVASRPSWQPEHLLARAAVRMYDAEGALHLAHQAHIDAWVVAAYTQLHNAIAYRTACLLLIDA